MGKTSEYPPLSEEAKAALERFMHLLLDHAPDQDIHQARLDFMRVREQDKQRAAQQHEESAGDATSPTT